MSRVVLDASALMAVLWQEDGMQAVEPLMATAFISTVNLSEVVTKGVERGLPLESLLITLTRITMSVVDFDAEQAYLAASLRPATRELGLSLADRACLALGLKQQVPVLTADRSWAKVNVGVEVRLIR